MNKKFVLGIIMAAVALSGNAIADSKNSKNQKSPSHSHGDDDKGKFRGPSPRGCPVAHAQLEAALKAAQAKANGGLGFHMWASVVNEEGIVCAVAKSGNGLNSQWLGSRVISAQKAYTANAFSLDGGLALSTANLYSATQPGGSLFGLQHSNPVDTQWAYAGNAKKFGRPDDPMVGRRIGGINVFGGGLALYNENNRLVGAIGVSGDTSCADHNIAWRVRDLIGFDHVPSGVASDSSDNIIFDVVDGVSTGGFGHVTCSSSSEADNAAVLLDAPLN